VSHINLERDRNVNGGPTRPVAAVSAEESVFRYHDAASSRARISAVTEKLASAAPPMPAPRLAAVIDATLPELARGRCAN
jgi:hypothetical protein